MEYVGEFTIDQDECKGKTIKVYLNPGIKRMEKVSETSKEVIVHIPQSQYKNLKPDTMDFLLMKTRIKQTLFAPPSKEISIMTPPPAEPSAARGPGEKSFQLKNKEKIGDMKYGRNTFDVFFAQSKTVPKFAWKFEKDGIYIVVGSSMDKNDKATLKIIENALAQINNNKEKFAEKVNEAKMGPKSPGIGLKEIEKKTPATTKSDKKGGVDNSKEPTPMDVETPKKRTVIKKPLPKAEVRPEKKQEGEMSLVDKLLIARKEKEKEKEKKMKKESKGGGGDVNGKKEIKNKEEQIKQKEMINSVVTQTFLENNEPSLKYKSLDSIAQQKNKKTSIALELSNSYLSYDDVQLAKSDAPKELENELKIQSFNEKLATKLGLAQGIEPTLKQIEEYGEEEHKLLMMSEVDRLDTELEHRLPELLRAKGRNPNEEFNVSHVRQFGTARHKFVKAAFLSTTAMNACFDFAQLVGTVDDVDVIDALYKQVCANFFYNLLPNSGATSNTRLNPNTGYIMFKDFLTMYNDARQALPSLILKEHFKREQSQRLNDYKNKTEYERLRYIARFTRGISYDNFDAWYAKQKFTTPLNELKKVYEDKLLKKAEEAKLKQQSSSQNV